MNNYEDFLTDLAARESGGKYDIQNSFGYSGKYQMGEAALIDAGYYKPDSTKGKYQDWIGSWTGKDNVNSINDFLHNSTAQENAIRDYMAKQWQYIERFGLEKYVGQNIGGIEITESGLLAAAHLKGVGSLLRFLKSGGEGTYKDGYGTDIREYLRRFSNYNVPYGGNSSSKVINNLFNKINDVYNDKRDLFNKTKNVYSPIILDLDRDGVETTGLKDGAYFDHDGNGFAEQTGWASSDDGLLVLDKNGNGIIDNGTELFGNETLLQNGQKAANGFQALEELDGTHDGTIDVNDAAYTQLLLWQDVDGDGYSATDELFMLNELGIKSINTGYTNSTYVDVNGNEHKQVGSYTRTDNSSGTATDVWFKADKMYTIANEWLDVPADIAALPDLQGYGNVYDLHQAMVRDTGGQLKSLVQQFTAATDPAVRTDLMNQILFKWTGSDGITPGSYGDYIDARKVGVLEKVFGQYYMGNWSPTVAGPNAASLLSQSYDGLYEMCYAQLMAQTHLKDLYNNITYQWDEETNSVTGDLTAVATILRNEIDANYVNGVKDLTEFVRSLNGLNATESMNFSDFCSEVAGGDSHVYGLAFSGGKILSGTSGDDTVNGTIGSDLLYGGAGNDSLYGGARGADWFDGGSGNDTMIGGSRNDTYVFGVGSGNDVVFDTGGNDIICFTEGLSPESLEFNLTGVRYDNGIVIRVKQTGESIRLQNWFAGDDFKIERLKFSDNSEMTASEINALAISAGLKGTNVGEELWGPDNLGANIYGNGGDDTVHGGNYNDTIDGGIGTDMMYGGGGNDMLYGDAGNDNITGEDGNDTLDGGTGADTMVGGTGDDTYVVDNVGDVVTESSGEGTDTIQSSGTYTLGANVENLTLTGSMAINGTGNELNNILSGNSATNVLTGGMGNDIYVISGTEDTIIENTSEGADTVQSSITYTLGTNLENLTLTGSTAINGTGNELDNVITGNSMANILNGYAGDDVLDGGTEADNMIGGIGNDIYILDNAGDVVVENTDEGIDTVQSLVTYTLRANLENLTLTGSTAINGTGNDLDNTIYGNNAANILTSGGGLNYVFGARGNDTIYGGNERDELHGDEGDDLIYGGAGEDFITGNDGNDTLRGGAGDDYIHGGVNNFTDPYDHYSGAGNDTYLFGRGDGYDRIFDRDATSGNIDTILLDSDVSPSDIKLRNSDGGQGSLWLSMDGTSVEMVSWSKEVSYGSNNEIIADFGDQYKIERIQFADNTIWDIPMIKYMAVQGTEDADWIFGFRTDDIMNGKGDSDNLYGYDGNDTLDGGTGNDILYGSIGNDTYVFGRGYDQDVVTDWSGAPNVDAILLTSDVQPSDVTLNRTGMDLVLSINGTTDTMTVSNWFDLSGLYQVERIQFADGTAWDAQTITLMSGIKGTAGNDTILGSSAAEGISGLGANDQLYGREGDDILDGGSGNDSLYGEAGSDTYIVDSAGDVVTENANEGTDTIQSSVAFTLGANVENLTLTGSSAINGTGNALDNALTGNSGVNTLNGDAGNDTLNGGAGLDTMIGGTGNDTYVVDNTGDVVTENASEGTDTVQSSITYTLGSNVENLTLTGSSAINGTGNTLDNVLTGNNGANVLNGGMGADTMIGGMGNDTYVVDDTGDVVTESSTAGTDAIQSSVTYTLGANVENLTLTGSSAINGMGNTLDNVLTGNSGANILDGGTGADTMIGGMGNDTYVVDDTGDVVTENAGEGTDTVQSSITYTLGSNVENLTLTGSSAINGMGNTLDNVLTGNSGANGLSGGTGADTMIGGMGNDTYVVDDTGDVVTESSAAGTDTIQSSVTYTLSADVENLTLTGSDAINGTGNTLNNTLTGSSGANVLNGGMGADTMIGGMGNDTYIVDDTGDVVTESTSIEGMDTIQSSVTYTLSNDVENLTLMGSSDVNGTGNAQCNVLTGNSGANVLNGGMGADTMIGGMGNDMYVVDDTGDVVTENADEGTDTVQSSITYTLGSNVENLTLTGSDAINGTGNTLNNALTGNSGANVLDGGTGADTMIGGMGNDTYVVDNTGDVVTENASAGTDTIQSSVTYTLSANVENLTLAGSSDINGMGNTLNNALTGNSGANVLNGGTGVDTMIGGLGNDTYIVDNTGDVVTENIDEGTDTVQSSLTYALGSNIENLTLTGSSAINGTGNTQCNVLTGNSGVNVLNGGTGEDTMIGGMGNDTYVVDDTGDVVTESSGAGTDTIQSSVTYTLSANVENLTLTGSDAINGTGNTLNNTLTGNSGANVLNGGTGVDTMVGGTGDDTYVVVNAGDVVSENSGAGTDTIQSSVTYTLSANVENLTLIGSDTINGTGNTLNNALTGNSGANVLNGGTGVDTMIGGLGNDTYIVDNTGDVVTENIDEGTDTVQSSITYTLGSNVENLTLTGSSAINGMGNTLDNVLTGNSANNTLTDGAGNDTLNGSTGADTMIGGTGDDMYVVDNNGDVVTENTGEGTDTVQSSITYTLGSNVENLTLTGSSAINGMGNTLDNVLTGNSGMNVLNGGTGVDTMIGGLGNDTYIVDNTGDVVTENIDEGTDTVQSSLTYTLGSNVENLTLTGSSAINGTGNTLDNVLTGNSSANSLTGGDGNDTLSGGTGTDTMIGGVGNDTYVVDNMGDVVTENAGEGTDTVQSSIAYTLGSNVENLTLTGGSAINGTGNTLDNVLTGNSGANTLTANAGNDTLSGGTGTDTMIGGVGNDTYVVDNMGDVVTENAGEGTDTVQSSIAYTLGSNVENLTLTGGSAINGTGNTLDNVLTGNSGANTLTANAGNDTLSGGTGTDTMIGGVGNDTYVVDNMGDVVTENAGEGTDTVQSSIAYTLGSNVENLTLTGGSAINGTGNTLDNVLTGNSGANTLTANAGNDTLSGGTGTDTMIGGVGNDTYVVDNMGDVVTENAGEGTDTVQSSIAYTLGSNVENLTLTGGSAINGTGNTLDNVLTGNSGANTLTGNDGDDTLSGLAGNDIMSGGSGCDTYMFRRTDGIDTVSETTGISGDTDTLKMTDGITETEPVIVKQNNDLYIFIDTNNYVKVTNEFYQVNYGIERLEVTDGYYITRSDIENIVNTMSAINNDSGMDVIQKFNAMRVDQTYINTLAQSWHQP